MMKQTIFGLLMCLTVSLSHFASAAQSSSGSGNTGNFYIEETFFPVYVKKNDGSTTQQLGTESGLGFDLRTTFGYVWQNVIFGLSYNYYSVNTSRPMTADNEGLKTSTTKSEYGPTIGYILNDWHFLFTYLASATKGYHEVYTLQGTGAVDTDNNTHYTDGTGFQLEIAYALDLGGGFSIGPTLIYREVKYKKQSLDALSGSYSASSTVSTPVDADLKPMITLSYRF